MRDNRSPAKRRLYKFYNSKYALRNLAGRKLKISTLDDVNDPFEFDPFYIPNRAARKKWRTEKEKIFREIGMICFSSSWSNPEIWSHYADGHKGLCLGFDVSTDSCLEVRYVEEREDFPLVSTKPIHESYAKVLHILSAKYQHWSYENEVRKFVGLDSSKLNGDFYFEPFSEKLVLKEVIIGSRSTVSEDKLREVIGSEGVDIVTARIAFQTYTVTKQLNSRLQR